MGKLHFISSSFEPISPMGQICISVDTVFQASELIGRYKKITRINLSYDHNLK